MILLIDNYDSFTYNLYQVFLKLNYPTKVVRNDKITISEIEKLNPSYIVLSPGPGTPNEAGITMEVVNKFKGIYPILGVCLGHQSILAAFGTPIVNAQRIVHGKVERIIHNGKGLFRNIPTDTSVTRYHSLVAKEKDIPDCFEITAKSEDGEVMAVEHKEYHLIGVQFHPESIGTKDGEKMIINFLHYRKDNVPVKEYLSRLVIKNSLSFKESYDIMDELTENNLTEGQIGSLLTALQINGFTSEIIAGFATVLKKKAISFPKPATNEKRLDTCGTGGSTNAKTFNVSTISSILANACGANIVKHGNRAITSKSGSADLLEKLGVNVDMSVETCIDVYNKIGITFLYARKFHAAMRFASPVRSSLGFRTIFNLLGPLSNPAYATHQIIGIFDKDLTEKVCEALNYLGIQKAMVVSGFDGLDELSLSGPTKISELDNGWIKTYIFNPETIGISTVNHSLLVGGDPETNKNITLEILEGSQSPKANLAYLNTGASLYLYGLAESIRDGFYKAKEVAKSKKGLTILDNFVKLSNKSE